MNQTLEGFAGVEVKCVLVGIFSVRGEGCFTLRLQSVCAIWGV